MLYPMVRNIEENCLNWRIVNFDSMMCFVLEISLFRGVERDGKVFDGYRGRQVWMQNLVHLKGAIKG